MKKLGFIGCGLMGKNISLNLLKAGYPLTVYDVNPEAVKELVAAGAKAAGSPCEVAEQAEVVFTALPYPSDVEQVVCGADGVLDGAKGGLIIIDMSTVDPKTTRKLAEVAAKKQVEMLHTPMSGGPTGAAAATLTIMVGGKQRVYEECQEIIKTIGKNIFYIGEDPGLAAAVKLCNNILFEMQTIGIAETFVFGVKLGLTPKIIYDVLSTIRGGDWLLEHKCPYPGVVPSCPANKDFEPDFFNDLMVKDMGLAMSTAKDMKLPLLMCSLAYEMCQATSTMGQGKKDFSAVTRLVQQLAGIEG